MVYSSDGIAVAEALDAQKRLAALISYKLKQEYSEMCGFVRERMSLAIVSSNSLLHPSDQVAVRYTPLFPEGRGGAGY